MELTAIGAFVGAVLSLIFTVIIESLRNPKLTIVWEEESSGDLAKEAPAKRIKLLRVKLTNKKISRLFWWLRREPAIRCTAEIQLRHCDTKSPLFTQPIQARWSRSEPPSTIHFDPKTNTLIDYFDPSTINERMFRDCCPDSEEPIDVIARFDSDEECYVWNNDSFYPNYLKWRNEKVKIPKGKYFVIITVRSLGEKKSGFFILENNLSIDDFRLIETTKQQAKMLNALTK